MTFQEAHLEAIKTKEAFRKNPELFSNQIIKIFACFKDCKKAEDYLNFLTLHKNDVHDDSVLFSNYIGNSSADEFTVCIQSIIKGLTSARLFFEQLKINHPEIYLETLSYLDCEKNISDLSELK